MDVMLVPGHSRRYVDIHKLAVDAAREGIDAFHRLLAHFDARDFDVLVVRDGDRFARTQSLHAYVVESTINVGARIFSLIDGWVEERNYRMWISMSGYKAAGAVDNLVQARKIAMDNLAKRGLPTSSVVLMSHYVARDEKGRATGLKLDESKRQLWSDLAELVLEGIPWREIEIELFRRYGHANHLGEPFHRGKFNKVVNTPTFWGHSARFHRSNHKGEKKWKIGEWVYEPGHPIPEGVAIYYDTHESVWVGDIVPRIKAELARRRSVVRGKSVPDKTYKFSGLFLCSECGYTLAVARKNGYAGIRCVSKYLTSSTRTTCDSTRHLPETRAREYISQRLQEMLAAGTPEAFTASDPNEKKEVFERLRIGEREILSLESQISVLILKEASADPEIRDLYVAEIAKATLRLKALRAQLRTLQEKHLSLDTSAIQRHTFDELATMTIDFFWTQEDRRINQMLHRLMGNKRFVVQEGQIIGVAEARVRRQRY
jgi:DNA invertase Pin-like site-specific DNA recombinase